VSLSFLEMLTREGGGDRCCSDRGRCRSIPSRPSSPSGWREEEGEGGEEGGGGGGGRRGVTLAGGYTRPRRKFRKAFRSGLFHSLRFVPTVLVRKNTPWANSIIGQD